MYKHFTITILSTIFFSCTTQKKNNSVLIIKPNNTPSSTQVVEQTPPKSEKPTIEKSSGVEFFKINISNPTKNDNTISWGSIVSASPKHYTVTKKFFPAMGQNFRQKYIILHYTAIDDEKSIRVLSKQGVSSHYLINSFDDKEIYQLVDENKRAYHAGVSYWRGNTNLNDTSIGIEIVNTSTNLPNGEFLFVPFPDYQIAKVAALVKDIAQRYDIPPTNILAHSDIAPTRKQDPGPLFPWKRLYTEHQIGMWYDDSVKQQFMNQISEEEIAKRQTEPTFIYKCQVLLSKFGYNISQTGEWDKPTRQTITAFQYHFRPEKYDGIMDLETYAILQALVQKYKQ